MNSDNRTFSRTISSRISARGRREDGQPNPIDIYIGQRIRQRREMLFLSQENFGRALGLAFQQVQKYEKGQNRVSASRLWDIAQLLMVDFSYFFQGMDDYAKNNSPRVLAGAPKTENLMVFKEDPLFRADVLFLVHAYLKIGSPVFAEHLREIAAAFADSFIMKKRAYDKGKKAVLCKEKTAAAE